MALSVKIQRPQKKIVPHILSPEHCPPPEPGEMFLGVKTDEIRPKIKKKSLREMEREAIDLRVSVAKESLAREVQRQSDMIGSIPF